MISPTSSEGRVMVALADGPLVWTPTWTCVDVYNSLVSGFDIHRGRQTELEITETSTATVFLNDRSGYFDPANTLSPFYGFIGRQIVLQVWNPVTNLWVRQFRGHIDDVTFEHNPATHLGVSIVSSVQLQCVGIMDWLAQIEMDLTGEFGNVPPVGSEAVVFYEDTDEDDGTGFQLRVTQILDDAGLDTNWYVVFTGNIDVLEGLYDPGDSPLVAIREALDAEFPGVANGYEDKQGRFVAHGRKARFDPEGTAEGADWTFTRWPAGDGAAILLDPTRAQIRPPLRERHPRDLVRNVAAAWPANIHDEDKAAQYVVDGGTSIASYGRRPWRAEKLLTKRGTTTGNTANEETKLFATYMVANYAQPRTRPEAVTFKSISLRHDQAAVTWALMLGADISDVINLEHGYAGGVGISEDFYIEGSDMSVRPLNPAMDLVEVSFNVSPTAYYGDDVGMLAS